MPQEARVGLKFYTEGMQSVIQEIGSLAEALGQAGRVVVNPYNPALSMSGAPGTMGTVQMAGEPGTFSSGGYPAGMPGYSTGPGYVPAAGPGYQMSGGMGSASITVGKVDVLNVQSASVVNIYGGGGGGGGAAPGGGGFIGGGGPGYGPSPGGGGIVTPYGIVRDQGGGNYAEDRSGVAEWFNPQWQPKGGKTPSSYYAPWNNPNDFILPPAPRVGPDPMSTPAAMASDAGLQRYYDQFASGQTDLHFSGPLNDPGWQQQQYQIWRAKGGTGSFTDFLNTGKMGGGGGGGFFQGLAQSLGIPGLSGVGPLAGGLAAGYGLHVAMQMASIGMSPMLSGTSTTTESLASQMLSPLAGIPIVGMPFGMVQQRLGALDTMRNEASRMSGLYGSDSGELERIADASGRGPWDQLIGMGVDTAVSSLSPLLHMFGYAPSQLLGLHRQPGNTAVGIPHLRSREAMQALSSLKQANPEMSDAQVAAMATQIANNPGFGGRPGAIMAGINATADALGSRNANPYLMGRGLAGDSLSMSDLTVMAQEASLRGDLSGVQSIERAARANGYDLSVFGGMKQSAVTMAQLGQSQQVAGMQMGLVQGEQARVSATMGGAVAQAGAIQAEGPVADQQLAIVRARIAQAQNGDMNDPGQRAMLLSLQAEEQQIQTGIASRPFRTLNTLYQGQIMGASASRSYGETTLGMTQTMLMGSGSEMTASFTAITRGKSERLSAEQSRLHGLLGLGLGDDNEQVRAARAAVRAAEVDVRTDSTFQRETAYSADSQLGGMLAGTGSAMMGVASRHELMGGGATSRAQQVIMSGLNEQLEAALRNMAATLADPGHTSGQVRQSEARIAQAREAIDASMTSFIQQRAQDMFAAAGQSGAVVGAQIAGMVGAGFAPTAGQQATQSASIDAQIAQARQNYAQATDPRQKMMWEQQIAQLEAQKMTLPLTQIEQRLAPGFRSAGAEQGIASAEVQIARQYGAGSADTRSMEIQGVQAAEREAQLAGQRVAERRQLYQDGKIDKSMVDEAEAQEAASRLKATQLRTGLGQVTLPLAMREQREVTEYSLNVLRNTPGAYGNIRGLLQGQMGQLENEAAYIQNEMRERPGTPEAQHQMRQRLREIGLEQHNVFQELSQGWENRLISTMINAPGNMNLEGRGFAMRDAVLRGVTNPHFGMRGGQLPHFLREANLMGGITLPPGVRNADSDHVGTPWGGDVTPAGFGRFGRAGRFSGGGGGDHSGVDDHSGEGGSWGVDGPHDIFGGVSGSPTWHPGMETVYLPADSDARRHGYKNADEMLRAMRERHGRGTRASFPTRPGATAGSGREANLPGRESGMPSGGTMMLPGRGDLPEERGGGGGGGQSSVSIEVIIKNEKGDVLGRGRPGAAGFVTEGVTNGGLEDALTIMGITVAQQN